MYSKRFKPPLTSHCVIGTFRVFLKRLSQFQHMFLVVKVGVSCPIHSGSFMSCKLWVSAALFYPITMYSTTSASSLALIKPHPSKSTVRYDWSSGVLLFSDWLNICQSRFGRQGWFNVKTVTRQGVFRNLCCLNELTLNVVICFKEK